jgi:hypothetical protein
MTDLLVYAIVPIAIAAVAVVLLFGFLNFARGGSPETSQRLMRWRVLLQFVALVIIMATIWMLGR